MGNQLHNYMYNLKSQIYFMITLNRVQKCILEQKPLRYEEKEIDGRRDFICIYLIPVKGKREM